MDKPWENEPNYEAGKAWGYDYVIKRNPYLGTLCGYVKLKNYDLIELAASNSMEHPAYYMAPFCDMQVHGGLTFAGTLLHNESDKELPGQWIGFDCGHSGDLVPKMNTLMMAKFPNFAAKNDIYRDINYVREQCGLLALQLMEEEGGQND